MISATWMKNLTIIKHLTKMINLLQFHSFLAFLHLMFMESRKVASSYRDKDAFRKRMITSNKLIIKHKVPNWIQLSKVVGKSTLEQK